MSSCADAVRTNATRERASIKLSSLPKDPRDHGRNDRRRGLKPTDRRACAAVLSPHSGVLTLDASAQNKASNSNVRFPPACHHRVALLEVRGEGRGHARVGFGELRADRRGIELPEDYVDVYRRERLDEVLRRSRGDSTLSQLVQRKEVHNGFENVDAGEELEWPVLRN